MKIHCAVLSSRKMVDQSLSVMYSWPAVKPDDNFFMAKADLQLQIAINRLTVNSSTPEQQLAFFTDIVTQLLTYLGDAVIRSQATEQRWQDITAYYLFICGKEGYAAERSSGTVTFGRGESRFLPMTHWCQYARTW